MSSSTPSDISQNNAEMLKEQCCEMQQRHEEEQQSLLQLQEAAEACCAERVAQKARRETDAKAKKEAEKRRIVEKKKLEYIQQLWDEVEGQKRNTGRKKVGMMWRGPRMALEKVRRRGLHCLPPVSILVLFFSLIEFFIFL